MFTFLLKLLRGGIYCPVMILLGWELYRRWMTRSLACVLVSVGDYSRYKKRIRFKSKKAVPVSVPSDTVRHINCEKIFHTLVDKPLLTAVCMSCSSFKWHLMRLNDSMNLTSLIILTLILFSHLTTSALQVNKLE